MNRRGLSDIVTTFLIYLLVAVAIAAIWSFVAPALRSVPENFNVHQLECQKHRMMVGVAYGENRSENCSVSLDICGACGCGGKVCANEQELRRYPCETSLCVFDNGIVDGHGDTIIRRENFTRTWLEQRPINREEIGCKDVTLNHDSIIPDQGTVNRGWLDEHVECLGFSGTFDQHKFGESELPVENLKCHQWKYGNLTIEVAS